VLREEYTNDDSKESSQGSESYDLITYMKEKAGRTNLCKRFVLVLTFIIGGRKKWGAELKGRG